MAENNNNNNNRGRNAPAAPRGARNGPLPRVAVPNGSIPDETFNAYVAQFGTRMRLEVEDTGHYNVHAVDAMRRNIAEHMVFDGRRARALGGRVSGNCFIIAPSARVLHASFRGDFQWMHALVPTLMAEDKMREEAVALLQRPASGSGGRASLIDINDWNADMPIATRTFCRHTWQECTCQSIRCPDGPFFYSCVDVMLHVPPADVPGVLSRTGCTGVISAHTVQTADMPSAIVDGHTMVRHRVAGTGEFVEYDYRGMEAGGLWRMRDSLTGDPADGVVITAVCEMMPDNKAVIMSLQPTKSLFGRHVAVLGRDEVVQEESAPSCEVLTRGVGDARELRLSDRGRVLSVATTAEALRIARRTPLPRGNGSTANAMATLKQALKLSGCNHSDADVSAIYTYAVSHAARSAVSADDVLVSNTGVSFLPVAIAAHVNAAWTDDVMRAIVDRATRFRATRREVEDGTGPTATALLAVVCVVAGAAVQRTALRRAAPYAFAASAVLSAYANWPQFAIDTSVVVRRAAPGVLGLAIAAAAASRLPTAAVIDHELATWMVEDLGPQIRALGVSFSTTVDELLGMNQGELRAWAADVSARVARTPGAVNWMHAYVVIGAPLSEECAKRAFGPRHANAIALGIAAFEAVTVGMPLPVAFMQAWKHLAMGWLPYWAGVALHAANNITALAVQRALADGHIGPRGMSVVGCAQFAVLVAVTLKYAPPARVLPPPPIELATFESGHFAFRGVCVEDLPTNYVAAGVPIAAVCYKREFDYDPRGVVAGNVLKYEYVPGKPCAQELGGYYCGGVHGYCIGYPAPCAHNANAGLCARVLVARPHGIEDDEMRIGQAYLAMALAPAGIANARDAKAVAEATAHDREAYIESLATRALRVAAETAHQSVGAFTRPYDADLLTYQVKVEKTAFAKQVVQTGEIVPSTDVPKTPRAIIAPPAIGKQLNSANHAAGKAFYAMTAAREEYRLVKYEGDAEDAAEMVREAVNSAIAYGPAGQLVCVRADISKCDASQGPGVGNFVFLNLAHLGVINFEPPRNVAASDRTAEVFTWLRAQIVGTALDAVHCDDVEVRERTLNAEMFRAPRFAFTSDRQRSPRAQVAQKMPSGVGWTSDQTTMLVSTTQAAALDCALRAVGAPELYDSRCITRYVRGDDNFVIIALPRESLPEFERVFAGIFATVGFKIDISVAPMHDGLPLVPLCSHLMYPALSVDGGASALPAPRVGRVLTNALVVSRSVPQQHVAGSLRATAKDMLHNCGHVRLLAIFAERLLFHTNMAEEYRAYDRDAMYHMTAKYSAVRRRDDARCTDFIAAYYAQQAGLDAGAVKVAYLEACRRMETWVLGEPFEGGFEEVCALVDRA